VLLLRKRDSKGVSEIVATVLMIMIVTAIGFSIFLYGMGFFTASTSARDQATQTGIATLRERFVVVDVAFTTVDVFTSNVTIWVYNYGETNININSIYINGSQHNNTKIDPAPPVFIVPTGITKIVCINSSANANYTQLIRVVSSLGNFYENYYKSE